MKVYRKRRRRGRNNPLSILLVLLAVLAALVVLAAGIFAAQYFHRSSPSAVREYETTNPHIRTETAVTAHRSGAGEVPEELMAAFKYCIENSNFNVDYFEFDLHLTKDNQLVLLHDDKLDRTSNCEEVFGETDVEVGDKTLAELRRLNMGAKFVNEKGERPYADLTRSQLTDDLRIATLDQVLDYLTAQGDFNYIIEIKDGGDRGLEASDLLYQNLKRRGLLQNAFICSFHNEVLRYVDETYPDALRGAASADVIDFYLHALINSKSYAPSFDALQLPFGDGDFRESYFLNLGLAKLINYAHQKNVAVQFWTINEVEEMEYLLSIGADGIMTDYPNLLFEVMGRDTGEGLPARDFNLGIRYLLALQTLRDKTRHLLDGFFALVTELGSSTVMLLIIALLYWCVDKQLGFFVGFNALVGLMLNGFIKITACVYRPWLRDSRVQPLEKALKHATGYSFPSGHTTIAGACYGGIAVKNRKRNPLLFAAGIFLWLLVAFSRNYVGVHTPQDVIVAFLQGIVMLWLTLALEDWLRRDPERDLIVSAVVLVLGVALMLYSQFKRYPLAYGADGHLLVNPIEMATDSFSAAGAAMGFALGWVLERRMVCFNVDGDIWQRLIRFVTGIAVVLAIKEGLGPLLERFISVNIAAAITMGLLTLYVIFLHPLFFQRITDSYRYGRRRRR